MTVLDVITSCQRNLDKIVNNRDGSRNQGDQFDVIGGKARTMYSKVSPWMASADTQETSI